MDGPFANIWPIRKFPIPQQPNIPELYAVGMQEGRFDIVDDLRGPSIRILRQFKINAVFLPAV